MINSEEFLFNYLNKSTKWRIDFLNFTMYKVRGVNSMKIDMSQNFGTVEGYLVETNSETFQKFCQRSVGQEKEIDRLKESLPNDRITVVSQFDPDSGTGNDLMNELKSSSMGAPILVVVDPFSDPIDGMGQKEFYLNHGFEEMDFHSGDGQVMILK